MNIQHDNELINKLNFQDVLLDSLPNPVYYKDTEGRFIRCNSSFSKLVNTPKKDIIGKLAYEFFPKSAADRHRPIDLKIMQTLENYADEIVFPLKNGEVKYFILNKAVYLNQDGSVGGIVCVMNDITHSIKEKEFLIQQSKLAEMGEMVASIAHQWNEPLVEISAQVQKAELNFLLNKMNEKLMSTFVKDTMIQIKYMSETLSDFRNFLKPSTVKKEFLIKKSIDEIFEIIGKQLFYFNIKLSFLYEDENTKIYGYENELKQVLLNIINNAKHKIIKKSESSDFKGTISIIIKSDEKFNTINIRDNAGAIDEDIIDQIFEPFFTTKVDGTGFGLYMSKIIVQDNMSGIIEVKNYLDNVEFSIKIPNKKDENF